MDFLPLPFRIILLLLVGNILYYLLILILVRHHINFLQLLNFSYSSSNYSLLDYEIGESTIITTPLISENEEILAGISKSLKLLLVINAILYITYIFFNTPSSLFDIIPLLSLVFTFYKFFFGSTPGLIRASTTLFRVLTGNISLTMRSNDILLSDTFVSFSKVFNDFFIFILNKETYPISLELFILSIPTLIRIKQCFHEYKSTKKISPIFNSLKYFSSLLPLIVNYFMKLENLSHYFNLWLFLSFFSSSFSFFWDIKMDWGFNLFNKIFDSNSKFIITRQKSKLVYTSSNLFYYLIIIINLCLRFIWILKIYLNNNNSSFNTLSTFLFGYNVYSLGYFLIEFLEIFRRWLWCFIKLENDWLKIRESNVNINLIDVKTS